MINQENNLGQSRSHSPLPSHTPLTLKPTLGDAAAAFTLWGYNIN